MVLSDRGFEREKSDDMERMRKKKKEKPFPATLHKSNI